MPRFAASVLLTIMCALPAQAQVHVFEGPGITHIENLGELSQNQQAGLEKFADGKPYFGAIFMEVGGSGWGSFTGAHRLSDAFDMAHRICMRFASGGACTLAGVSIPADFDPDDMPADSLSARAAEKHAIYSTRTEGYRAFAVSGTTAFGWATRQQTALDAAVQALEYCHSSALKKLLLLDADLREKAIEDGFYSCRIVDQSGPPS